MGILPTPQINTTAAKNIFLKDLCAIDNCSTLNFLEIVFIVSAGLNAHLSGAAGCGSLRIPLA